MSIDRNAYATEPGEDETTVDVALRWRRWIEWERCNLMKLGPPVLQQRVRYALKRTLLVLAYYPDMWVLESLYLAEIGAKRETLVLLEKARELMPRDPLVFLATVDAMEDNGAPVDEVRALFENIIVSFERQIPEEGWDSSHDQAIHDVNLLLVQFLQYLRRAEGTKSARMVFSACTQACLLQPPHLHGCSTDGSPGAGQCAGLPHL